MIRKLSVGMYFLALGATACGSDSDPTVATDNVGGATGKSTQDGRGGASARREGTGGARSSTGGSSSQAATGGSAAKSSNNAPTIAGGTVAFSTTIVGIGGAAPLDSTTSAVGGFTTAGTTVIGRGGTASSGGASSAGGSSPAAGGSSQVSASSTSTAEASTVGGSSAGAGGSSASTTAIGGAVGVGGTSASVGGESGIGGATSSTTTAAPTTCTSEGATECNGPFALRTCTGGTWVESQCGGYQACADGACRNGCPELGNPSDTSIACYMPADPFGDFRGAPRTIARITTDVVGLPSSNVGGAALDSLDTDGTSDDPCTSTEPVIGGRVWRTASASKLFDRMYLNGWFVLSEFVDSYGARPLSVTFHVKIRRLNDAAMATPQPIYMLWNRAGIINDWGLPGVALTPTSDWQVLEYSLPLSEVNLLDLGSEGNIWELDWADASMRNTPDNIEIAWFALSFEHPN